MVVCRVRRHNERACGRSAWHAARGRRMAGLVRGLSVRVRVRVRIDSIGVCSEQRVSEQMRAVSSHTARGSAAGRGEGGASALYHTPRDVRILITCEHAPAHLEGRRSKVREIRGKVREMEDLPLGSLCSAIQTWRTSKQTGWKKWCGSQLLVVGGSASGLDTLLEAMEGRPAPAAPPRDDTKQDRPHP